MSCLGSPGTPRLRTPGWCHNPPLVPDVHGAIEIARRPVIQDLLRRYVVLIDGQAVGFLWPGQTRRFVAPTGEHLVRLSTKEAVNWEPGRASSDEVPVRIVAGQTERLETRSRGASGYLPTRTELLKQFPAMFFPKAMYRRPWIVLERPEAI